MTQTRLTPQASSWRRGLFATTELPREVLYETVAPRVEAPVSAAVSPQVAVVERVAEAPTTRLLRSALHCPFCRDGFAPAQPKQGCSACLTWHHAECWSEGGGCATCGAAQRGTAALDSPSVVLCGAAGCVEPALIQLEGGWRCRECSRGADRWLAVAIYACVATAVAAVAATWSRTPGFASLLLFLPVALYLAYLRGVRVGAIRAVLSARR